MSTVLTGASSYCTAADFLLRYDVRTLAKLLSDTEAALETGAVATNDALEAALQQASGWVEAACLHGERYTPTDLAALTGNSQQMLVGLVADLAWPIILRRRPAENKPLPPQAEMALQMLDALAEGKRIFGFLEHAQAGHLDSLVETPTKVEERALATYTARRMFGTRNDRYLE